MKEYIKDMRALVGSRPIMQCGASVIVVNERGELLLQQRKDNGMWGYHGGSVELFENVETAARRELAEETGLTAGSMTLLGVFQRLIEQGATVIVIEHDLDVIKNADYIVDMGPGGGEDGGRIVACGTQEDVAAQPESVTGRYLKR